MSSPWMARTLADRPPLPRRRDPVQLEQRRDQYESITPFFFFSLSCSFFSILFLSLVPFPCPLSQLPSRCHAQDELARLKRENKELREKLSEEERKGLEKGKLVMNLGTGITTTTTTKKKRKEPENSLVHSLQTEKSTLLFSSVCCMLS